MTWSAVLGPPCRMSRAWPCAISKLTSSSAISRTTPPHCSAKPALEPTSPPPPIIETFILRGAGILPAIKTQNDWKSQTQQAGSLPHNLALRQLRHHALG